MATAENERMSLTDSSFIPGHYDEIGNARSIISSEGAAHRLTLAIAEDPASQSWFGQHDGPTLLVAAAIYVSWLSLLASYKYIPWWITAPLAGYVVQWHFSLQHEAIHSMRGLSPATLQMSAYGFDTSSGWL